MSRLIGWLNPWKNVPTAQSNVPTAKKVISRDESKIYVRKSIQLGKGKSKTASVILIDNIQDRHNFTLPLESNIDKFCLVEYNDKIKWDANMLENNECFVELQKIYEMGTEIDGQSFAPKLHQIRIDVNDSNGISIQGLPFSPEEMNTQFAKIGPGAKIKISYLIEKCDDGIIEYLLNHQDKEQEVCAELIKFIDLYVNTYEEFNTDCIKSENYCLSIMDDANLKIRLLDVEPKFCVICDKDDTASSFLQNAKVFMKYGIIGHSMRKKVKYNFGNLGLTQNEVDVMIRFFYTDKYMNYEYSPISMLYHYFAGEHPRNFARHFTNMPPLITLPEGWELKTSNTKGKTYYYNKGTGKSQWEIPYNFFYYNELIEYFKNSEEVVELFKILNDSYGVSLIGAPGTVKGGKRRKSKSKKRGGNPRKRTRKV